ncbi:MAG: hypothetical protein JWN71_105 [Xanthobacteraceae bacterium]|nr:hypothetical protein [Xanthobacteraceae bacterium]
MAGKTSFADAVCRAMLCFALLTGLPAHHASHSAAHAAAHSATGIVPADGNPTCDGNPTSNSNRTCIDHAALSGAPADTSDHGCDLGVPLRVALLTDSMDTVHACADADCGQGAGLPHPEKPPRR